MHQSCNIRTNLDISQFVRQFPGVKHPSCVDLDIYCKKPSSYTFVRLISLLLICELRERWFMGEGLSKRESGYILSNWRRMNIGKLEWLWYVKVDKGNQGCIPFFFQMVGLDCFLEQNIRDCLIEKKIIVFQKIENSDRK